MPDLRAKTLITGTIAVHVALFLYSSLYGILNDFLSSFGVGLEPITWPVFSIGAVLGSLFAYVILQYVMDLVKRFM